MTTTTDIKRQSEAPSAASEKPKQQTYGLDHKRLIAVHRNCKYGWKWASAEKITAEYQISASQLDHFHSFYGLPQLVTGDSKQAVYSLPALEVILETVPELND